MVLAINPTIFSMSMFVKSSNVMGLKLTEYYKKAQSWYNENTIVNYILDWVNFHASMNILIKKEKNWDVIFFLQNYK